MNQDQVKAFEKELIVLLNKYNVVLSAIPQFPIYNIQPDEVKLALRILEKHGVQYLPTIKLKKEDNANQK